MWFVNVAVSFLLSWKRFANIRNNLWSLRQTQNNIETQLFLENLLRSCSQIRWSCEKRKSWSFLRTFRFKNVLNSFTQVWENLICGSRLRQNRYFSFCLEVNIFSTFKLKLDIIHLKTCITVFCYHSQTLSFREWSGNRISGHAFLYKIFFEKNLKLMFFFINSNYEV